MRGSTEAVQDCTSQVFEGMLVLNNHDGSSWVAKWQRLENASPGVYAVKVVGQVSQTMNVKGGIPRGQDVLTSDHSYPMNTLLQRRIMALSTYREFIKGAAPGIVN